ncbi:MAG: phosphoribosylformylglycinamidine synthase subunit PurQ [Elusimicrobiales bacterium]|nr:phosphoribosylformylglycinamidine synthase subunit PurQ [Elusimicrobiales bacterium]
MGKKHIIKKPKVIILRACGTNCDIETENAFKYVGASTERVHINEVLKGYKNIDDYDIIALPGGFSFGDDISAGKIFALRIKSLYNNFKKFIDSKRPVIGICNGFQVLVKTGLLPYSDFKQRVTLFLNDCGHFLCRWVKVKVNRKSPSIFIKGLPEEFYLPIAHGEGKLIANNNILSEILSSNLDALKYIENPNGSLCNIAALTNKFGNVMGMMPHPERTFFSIQTPWKYNEEENSVGWYFFKNAVEYVK